MKKKIGIILGSIILLIIIIFIIYKNINKDENINDNKLHIVTSFYPIYIMTLNITNGIENVEVSNMASEFSGCIHDYTLTTSDLKKFEEADIFVENGFGMESFSQKIIETYPEIKVIESGKQITDYIYEDEENINAHFWTSIDNYILQVKEISNELDKIDNTNIEKYKENENKYINKLEELKKEYNEKLKNIKETQVLSLNESFSYLLKFAGIDEILIQTDHEQNSLSAETIRNVINTMNEKNIKAIIIEQNDDEQNANTIANETGAKIYRLKDCMSGDNTLDSYINTMKENLETLVNM